MADVQNVVDMVRETDNKILIHDTLTNNLKKWKDAILEFICKDNVCIKPDIKMKDTPVTKKKDTPVTKKKYTKKKDTKPVTKKKDTKPVTKKKYTPVTKKKDTRDTDKNILLKIIRNNIKVLNWINTNLRKSLQHAYIDKNKKLFDGLCRLSKCDISPFYKVFVSSIYAVNVSIESLQKGMMNKLGIKYIDYDSIKKIFVKQVKQVRTRFENKLHDTELKIRIAVREIEMVNFIIKLRYLNEEFHLINKTALNLMTQLSIEYNDLYDNQHETIRFISNIEDIDREYADIQKRRECAKNEKIAESKRVEDLHSKCTDTLGMLDKKIKGTRLKLREDMSNR